MSNEVKLDKEFNIGKDFEAPSYEEWKEKVIADLKGAPFEKKLITKTYERIELQPIYTKKDIESLPQTESKPGYSNLIRGTKASGYLGKSWDVCQELPYGDANEFNEALKADLERGQTAINITLDSASQMGLDADYAEENQVGDCGLSVSGLNSFARALKDIDIKKYPLYIQSGFSSNPMLMILTAYAKQNNIDLKDISGSVEADPVGYLVSVGKLPTTLKFTFNKMKIASEWTLENAPLIKTIGISGIPYNSAGASSVQELAYVMSTAVQYIEELVERGLKIDQIAKSIRLTFAIGPNYFMEIAKLRAARVLWSNIIDAYGGSDESKKVAVHGRTSIYNQTIYDPYVNMLRTTTEAFSAVIGGIDSLHTNTFNETFTIPNTFARRIARNTQIILNEESHLGELIDPAGGSFYVEKLTDEVAKNAWKEFQKIDELGGMIEALKANYPQEEIDKVVGLRNKDIRKRKNSIVGTNNYCNTKEDQPKIQLPNFSEFHKKRSDYLQKHRVSGESEKHTSIIEKLNKMVDTSSTEIIEIGAEAILEGATLGEISSAARATADESLSINTLRLHRMAQLFEELKEDTFTYEKKNGAKPKVFLATMGALKQFKARADFSRAFFEVAGFEIVYPNGFESNDDAVKAAIESGANAVVICSTDDNYPEIVPELVKGIKSTNPDTTIVLAGYPKDQIEKHKESGVDEFIFLGCDAYAVLSELLTKIGARG
jgi:methylmalonyl-CoA mutase